MKKLLLSVFAMAIAFNVMAVNVWDGSSEPWTNGSGTETDPYLIETAANLAYLAQMVNEGYQAQGMAVYAETYFLMTDDLDLNNNNWTPIGFVNTSMEGYYFAGVFNGGLHEITNLKIQTGNEVTGLFGGLADGPDGLWNPTIVENLFVTNATINSTGLGAGGIAGAIAGYSLIYRCGFSGTISISNSGDFCGGGGIVAVAAQNSRVVQCYFAGNITASNSNFMGAAGAGGIAGVAINEASIQKCYNKGTVTGTAMLLSVAAGIVAATMEDNEVTVMSCYNVGSLNANTKGGIFGMISPVNPFKGETAIDIQNSYYLNTAGGANGYGTGMSADEMRTEEFKNQIDQHSHAFVMDNGTNNGYPIHSLWSCGNIRVADITCHSAKLSAIIHQGNDTIERAYFVYKEYDADEWIEVDVPTDGYVEAELLDLEPETTYTYSMFVVFPDGVLTQSQPFGFQTLEYDAVASQEAPKVQVYPNPATDIVHIQGVDVAEVQVFNTLGQLVKTVRGTNVVNVGDLPAGTYLLRISTDSASLWEALWISASR
ncbi:MAG: T9SS type A sorting domain-containing protein [Bacteroidales bacterium]|nr:T9SS type A sorting domain-containing protein [Bacteroidales bacterium]